MTIIPLDPLTAIYGDGAVEQQRRYEQALAAFAATYGPGPFSIYRVPGRVNLIGEHTDYQQGYVLPAAIDKDILLLARPRDDRRVQLCNIEPGFALQRFDTGLQIPPQVRGDWGNYARGAAQMLCQQAGRPLQGMDLLVAGKPPYGIPRGSGLSSSSALTVGVAVVLADLNELGYTPAQLAWLCGEAEWYVGTRGGIMDQFAVLMAQRDHALFLDCRAIGQDDRGLPRFPTQQVPLPDGYSILVTDSHVHHQNTRSDFNVRVAEGRLGVALLQRRLPAGYGPVRYLRDLEPYDWSEIEPLLPEAMDWDDLAAAGLDLNQIIDVELPQSAAPFLVRQRCRHVVTENERVRQSVVALARNDVAAFAALMNVAHRSVSQDYGASCPEVELLVRLARQAEGVIAARMTGAGWGGCIVALCEQGREAAYISHLRPAYHEETGLWSDTFICRAGPGAGLVCRADVR